MLKEKLYLLKHYRSLSLRSWRPFCVYIFSQLAWVVKRGLQEKRALWDKYTDWEDLTLVSDVNPFRDLQITRAIPVSSTVIPFSYNCFYTNIALLWSGSIGSMYLDPDPGIPNCSRPPPLYPRKLRNFIIPRRYRVRRNAFSPFSKCQYFPFLILKSWSRISIRIRIVGSQKLYFTKLMCRSLTYI